MFFGVKLRSQEKYSEAFPALFPPCRIEKGGENLNYCQLYNRFPSIIAAVHTQGRQFENDTVATRMEKPIDARPSGLSAVTRTRKWIPPLPKRAPIFIDSG